MRRVSCFSLSVSPPPPQHNAPRYPGYPTRSARPFFVTLHIFVPLRMSRKLAPEANRYVADFFSHAPPDFGDHIIDRRPSAVGWFDEGPISVVLPINPLTSVSFPLQDSLRQEPQVRLHPIRVTNPQKTRTWQHPIYERVQSTNIPRPATT